jgi:hypothetical protein
MRDRASVAAATAIVGYDLMTGHRENRREFPREIVAVALTGSAAAGDAEAELYIGDVYIGRITNQRTGSEVLDLADWQPIGRQILPVQRLMARVTDAPATNPLVFHFITRP